MPTSYFFGFDVVQRNDDGTITPLADTDVDVYSTLQSTVIDTLTTDVFGVIPSQQVVADEGDLLVFSVDGFATTFERTTAADIDSVSGAQLSFVVDDAFAFTPSTVIETEVWLVNTDNPDYPPKLIGRIQPGQTITIPHDLTIDGENIDLYLINRNEQNIPDVLGLNEANKITVSLIAVAQDILSGDSDNVLSSDAQQVVSTN